MHKRCGIVLTLLLCCLLCLAARAEDAEDPVTLRALLVGCDEFLSHENIAPSAEMNVRRMANMLATDIRGYAAIVSAGQGVGSVQALRELMQQTFAEADDNDISLVYFCTHGLYDRVTFQPLLVLSDGISEENLTADSLRDALDAVAGQKVLILDACNSGAFIGKGAWDAQLRNSFQSADYQVLTSAGARENSFLWRDRDGVGGGSYFAQELCEGLRSREFDYNADGQVTLAEAYQGLLESHGASTAQSYPQQSDFALYAYDPDLADTAERPIGAITLDSAVLSEKEDTLYFSFTVRRAVRVQYQLIYYKNGLWRFDTPQTIEDPENETGALIPGRKERSVSLLAEEDEPYGYVLLQLVAQEGRRAMLAGSRLIAVQRDTGNPVLRIRCGESFDPAQGEELAVYVGHRFPCSLTVTVRDAQGRLIVELYGDGIADILRQGEGFSAGLSALLDVALTEPREMENEFGTCLEMHERAPFRAVVGIGRQQRSGVSVSGDSGCWFLTDAGVACLLLADGMGSGAAAAQDSRMLVSSMERFLRAGIPLGDALGAVSPALRLRSDGTRFVTLDALTLDLFTGQAESLKCGAAPSYVRTDGRWSVLAGKSLPVGLSDEKNQSQSVPLRLSHGDLFIMVSDGVSDGLDDAWVRELLREHGGEGPKELAARLVTEARGRGSDDDRTAIVMRVEKTNF